MLEKKMIIEDNRIMEYAIEIFDEHPRYGSFGEKFVKRVFSQYQQNVILEEVLTKVIVLDSLYSTKLSDVVLMAEKIVKILDIDENLNKGCLNVVESIRYSVRKKGKERRGDYSFATKYCCLHNQNAYPIYDSKVSKLLFEIKKIQNCKLTEGLEKEKDMYDYLFYKKIIYSLRNELKMNDYDYRKIDKGLYMLAWYYGNDLWVVGKLDCFLAVNGII